MPCGCAALIRIGRKGILRLRHTDRQIAIALFFPGLQLIQNFLIRNHFIGAINFLGHGFDFLDQ